jgi:hypothetical protein
MRFIVGRREILQLVASGELTVDQAMAMLNHPATSAKSLRVRMRVSSPQDFRDWRSWQSSSESLPLGVLAIEDVFSADTSGFYTNQDGNDYGRIVNYISSGARQGITNIRMSCNSILRHLNWFRWSQTNVVVTIDVDL